MKYLYLEFSEVRLLRQVSLSLAAGVKAVILVIIEQAAKQL
jgi:hypothetical protein